MVRVLSTMLQLKTFHSERKFTKGAYKMNIEKTLQLVCTVFGAVAITLALPELTYYAPPIHIIMYTAGIIIGGAGVRAIIRGR